MSWFEVESKIEVKKEDLEVIRDRVKKIARFTKRQNKFDQYFSLKKAFYPRKAFRIRSDGKENIVNFKEWIKKFWGEGVVVKEEYEFKIENKEHFLALMKDLGFKEWIKKLKISETYRHKKYKKLNIEINEVKGLGHFIEIEYLAKKSEINTAKYLIVKTIKDLKLNKNNIDNTGYTKMLWKKSH